MKAKLGRILYFVTWPGIWLVLSLTRNRTRVVVLHNDEILFVKDWLGNGRWKLPGGGMKKNEDPAMGAARELWEETGLKVENDQLKFNKISRISQKSITLNIYIYSYKLKTKTNFKLSHEIIDFKWISQKDLPKYSFSPITKAALFATIKDDYQKVL